MQSSPRLASTLAAIDAANAQDPNLEECDGAFHPKELLYGQRMSACLAEFAPDASEALQIAARAQHIERWKSPRSDFPEGRSGYKQWRSLLSLYHAKRAGEIMQGESYSAEEIEQVQFLIQKRQLKRNPETQTLEDVICLVFLKHYLEDFASKHEEAKLIDIIQKTWKKMSDKGQKAALELPFSAKILALLKKSLA